MHREKMTISERFASAINIFKETMPVAESELQFSNPYELIVAVMLSAQCTDKRVNLTTPELFRKYPTVEQLAKAEPEQVLSLIKSISYPNSKAAHLVGMARKVVSDYGSQIPTSIEDLVTLPGVGRKTANVVASVIWNAPVIAVDTHVFRVAHRLGLSRGKTPLAVETDLEKHIPQELRPIAHHWLILHGRYVCKALKPDCASCPLTSCCRHFTEQK